MSDCGRLKIITISNLMLQSQHKLLVLCNFVEQSIIWCPCELAECDVMQHHKEEVKHFSGTLSEFML